MESVFIAGSITIKSLPSLFIEKLDSLIAANLAVVIGDANGVDRAVQSILDDRGAANVTVFCSGEVPRNNLGNWPVKEIYSTAEPGTKAFFTAKDVAMAETAELGLMLWDAKSTGTLSNVIELTRRGKKTVVFVNKMDAFTIIRGVQDLQNLLKVMSDGALDQAEKKIGLSAAVRKLTQQQAGFSF
ncbi:hypothetical protein ACC702_36665 [Rhizobium ruizarguesonis]|jgi:hypothetical protein|uniref:hypothetical protein n=1 Tax=Rhizobium TaxID=379 RepID=UPI001030428E|nr:MULTISPECIES: hypothetical protein [Rhizobium]TAU72052.1 hypothetical protein ELI40_34275 [Rhizobium leguminosarum]TBD19636.1 hypothetical protein ELH23_01110 [Rhizobium ruizarguesonis]